MADLPDDLVEIATQTLVQYTTDCNQCHDEDLDELFSQIPLLPPLPGMLECPQGSKRFAPPVSDEEVKVAQVSAVPANTKKSTNWADNVWKDWRESRSKTVQSVVYCTNVWVAISTKSSGRSAILSITASG